MLKTTTNFFTHLFLWWRKCYMQKFAGLYCVPVGCNVVFLPFKLTRCKWALQISIAAKCGFAVGLIGA